jgi:5-methylcytosine-specific restriction enzyme subunit McrC
VALISVREYEKLHVGEFDSARPSVTLKQAELLTNLKPIYGFEVFKFVNGNTLSAQQFVGTVQLGSHTVEVLPKIDGAETDVRRNLVAMLAVAQDLEISEGDAARVAKQNHGILEILIRLFCDKLFAQVHRGLVRRYEAREDNLAVLRGRLGIAEQVRLNSGNPERLYCRFDEFQEDNPLNQILKAGVRFLLSISRDLRNQQLLAELMLVFEDVSDLHRQALPWSRVVFDRLSDRYRPCFKLVEMFLNGTPPDVSGGQAQSFSLFFDMNVLFEEYIGRIAQRVFGPKGYQVILQGPQKHLAVDLGSQRPVFAMKPDVVGNREGKAAWILDTKWKPLSLQKSKEGVQQDDLYQMYAYANCYDCSDVVLLYPHHQELGGTAGIRSSFGLNPWIRSIENNVRRVRIATVDLTTLRTVPEQMENFFIEQSKKTDSIYEAAQAKQWNFVIALKSRDEN